MKLSDVMKDSKIKIHATINGHGILLITKAEVGVRDGLLVDSLTYFEEDLTFSEPSKIVAINKRDGRSYEFTATRIGPVDTRYGKFHLIRCTEDGRIINRRMAERYDIDRLGVIRIGDKKDIRNALVYDISMKGIAFILDTDATTKIGDHIIASFRYDPNYFHFYACEATVVRKFTLNGQPAIGCTLDAMGADLVTLISSKKKEKHGLNVDDILGISESPDEKIASGDKIPVNYVPQLAVTEEYEREKHAHKWELEEKPKKKETQDDAQYLSPDEAADLIPERSVEDLIQARASRVADVDTIDSTEKNDHITDVDDLTDIDDISQLVSAEDLAELASIEDRTPHNASGVKSDLISPKKGAAKRKQAYWEELDSIEDRTIKSKGYRKSADLTSDLDDSEAPGAVVTPQKPRRSAITDPSDPNYVNNRNKKVTRKDLEAVTARESRAFKPSKTTQEKIDFISSMVSDEAMAASLKKRPGVTRTKKAATTTTKEKPKIKGALTAKGRAAEKAAREAEKEAAARAKKVRSTTAPVAPSEHQAKFVDAYHNSPGVTPAMPEVSAEPVAHTKPVKPKQPRKKYSEADGFFPDDYDGYFNQNGNSVDEGLFAIKRNDGFLTPEQIADIIELERISKNE